MLATVTPRAGGIARQRADGRSSSQRCGTPEGVNRSGFSGDCTSWRPGAMKTATRCFPELWLRCSAKEATPGRKGHGGAAHPPLRRARCPQDERDAQGGDRLGRLPFAHRPAREPPAHGTRHFSHDPSTNAPPQGGGFTRVPEPTIFWSREDRWTSDRPARVDRVLASLHEVALDYHSRWPAL